MSPATSVYANNVLGLRPRHRRVLSDGVSSYTYSHANRLATAVEGGTTYAFTYNGLGDRLRQTVNGSPTTYTLDLAAGLTEVLSDGANAYLYGNGRIGEEQAAGWVYHLGDALGSVRQLANPSGAVVMDRSYEPFGEVLTSTGTRTSNFQLAGQPLAPQVSCVLGNSVPGQTRDSVIAPVASNELSP